MASPTREIICFFGDTKRVRRFSCVLIRCSPQREIQKYHWFKIRSKSALGTTSWKRWCFTAPKKKSQLDDFQLLSVGCLNISKTQTWVQLPPSNSKISEALITSKNLVFQSWISEGDELPYLLISQLPLSKEYLRKPMKYPKSQTGRESILTCLAPPYPNTRAIRGLAVVFKSDTRLLDGHTHTWIRTSSLLLNQNQLWRNKSEAILVKWTLQTHYIICIYTYQ